MKKTFEVRDMRNGDWFWCYNALLSDPHLTPSDKLVYNSLATFGGCNVIKPSIDVIAKRAHLEVRTTIRGLKKLEAVGYVTIERGGGRHRTNIYYLLKQKKGCIKCQGLETVTKKSGNCDIPVVQTVTKTTPQLYKEEDNNNIERPAQMAGGEKKFKDNDSFVFPRAIYRDLIKSFQDSCMEIRGFQPSVDWGVSSTMIKRRLKEGLVPEDLKEEFDWYLRSEIAEKFGVAIKTALSAFAMNKWRMERERP